MAPLLTLLMRRLNASILCLLPNILYPLPHSLHGHDPLVSNCSWILYFSTWEGGEISGKSWSSKPWINGEKTWMRLLIYSAGNSVHHTPVLVSSERSGLLCCRCFAIFKATGQNMKTTQSTLFFFHLWELCQLIVTVWRLEYLTSFAVIVQSVQSSVVCIWEHQDFFPTLQCS